MSNRTMKVYLAARFSRKDELFAYKTDLEDIGITVTSRWLLGGHEFVGTPDEDIPAERNAEFAREDLEDIDAADVVICFTEPAKSGPARGGRHVEFGYALAKKKPIIVVGHRENVFYCLPYIAFCESWADVPRQLLAWTVKDDREQSALTIDSDAAFRWGKVRRYA